VFGRGEIGEREMQAREIGERCRISYVWLGREIQESERRKTEKLLFLISPPMRRKSQK